MNLSASDIRIDSPANSVGFYTDFGDFDGDGEMDLAMGDPLDDSVGTDSGVVYIVFGPLGPTVDVVSDASYRFVGGDGDQAGYSLTTGDYDYDGLEDVAVGIPYSDWLGAPSDSSGSQSNVGGVVIIYGGTL